MKIELVDKVRLGVTVLFCFCCIPLVAKVKLPAFFSDGMVLQRERPAIIWGVADPGEKVEIVFLKKNYQTIADEKGDWKIALPAQKAGGPYSIQVNDIALNDVLFGDVWLCSGQSNMELPVRRVMDMFADEINDYENKMIRHIKMPNTYNFKAPQTDVSAVQWQAVTKQDVMNYSALAYFFAKAMYDKTNVPVGIINASWGGTPVESWMSEEAMQPYPKYLHDKWRYENDDYVQRIKQLEKEDAHRWNVALYKGDNGLHEQPLWYASDFDDSGWQTVDLFSTGWGSNGLNPINGSHWFRKTVVVPETWNGKEATLRLGCVVDADSVFVNGVFVGTTSYQYPPRIYKVPAGVLKSGENNVTVRLISNGGYPHFVKEKPYKLISGDGEVSLEGNWKHQVGSAMPQAPSSTFFNYKPIGLYNAMIAPLRNLAFNGVIWYQGESNVSKRNEYVDMLSSMIADWRNTFADQELPFYIIEIADFLAPDNPERPAWAEFRQTQAQVAAKNYKTELIKNSDLGEWNDIHPLDKKTVANRAADCAWKDMQTKSNSKKKK